MTSPRKSRPQRVQYAALPYRRSGDSHTQVMLVTSRDSGRWVFPKGWPKKRRRPMARRRARRSRRPEWSAWSAATDRHLLLQEAPKSGAIVACEVRVFPLKVKRQQKSCRERGEREIQSFSRAKAAKAVRESALGDIIRDLE